MKQEKASKSYIVVIATCLALLGLISAYFMPMYENSVHGTIEKGIYNVLKYISNGFLINASIFFTIFVINKTISKNKKNEGK